MRLTGFLIEIGHQAEGVGIVFPRFVAGKSDEAVGNDAFVFRNGISEAIKLTFPTRKIGLVVACRTENPEGVITWPLHELITADTLRQLAADDNNLVLAYDAKSRAVKKFTGTFYRN